MVDIVALRQKEGDKKEKKDSDTKGFWQTTTSFLVIAALVVVVDQLIKRYLSGALSIGQSITIIPKAIYITLTHNTGMAFGMMQGQSSL